MTNNEAIARLQAAADIAITTGCELAKMPAMDAFAIADLLKEQEPVKPVIAGNGILERTRCGVCGSEIANSYVFCWYCGRKVKWDD